ncbi:hypothetical protein [Helicobacter sp. MIT 01-3238]|uniref:hypothetical protein n=1 Tax=Helicobacter sp. MIT 01-3238 TaxID=398627 RepID=UPI000E1EB96D|nr:hypothetical protein [Helicobacter sp. MIT 01-3238]RDU54735.1 hypothetical protein CQA40_02635 [Helicobacter sp. MIT 01-3238]
MSHITQAQLDNHRIKSKQIIDMRAKIRRILATLEKKASVHSDLQCEFDTLQNELETLKQDIDLDSALPQLQEDIYRGSWYVEQYAEEQTQKINNIHSQAKQNLNTALRLQERQRQILSQSQALIEKEEAFATENRLLNEQLDALETLRDNTFKEDFTIKEVKDCLAKNLSASIQSMRQAIKKRDMTSTNFSELRDKIFGIGEEFMSHIQDEEQRYDNLKSIKKALDSIGLDSKARFEPEQNTFIIEGKNFSGERASFAINDLGVRYEFKGYEGDSCFEGSSKVLEILKSIYSIDTSHIKLIEGNPDRIKKSAKPIPAPTHTNTGGHNG